MIMDTSEREPVLTNCEKRDGSHVLVIAKMPYGFVGLTSGLSPRKIRKMYLSSRSFPPSAEKKSRK